MNGTADAAIKPNGMSLTKKGFLVINILWR
jgi:hypothetical protein